MSKNHKVRQGDCIDSISYKYGFLPSTVWDFAANSDIKQLRKDGNILQPGDVIIVPDLEERLESCGDQQKHSFKRHGVPAVLRMVFSRLVEPEEEETTQSTRPYDPSDYQDETQTESDPEYEPLTNTAYVLNLDGELSDGTSDGEGMVEIPILPDAKKAKVIFFIGTSDEVTYEVDLGHIDSIEIPLGQRKRLLNLGYRCSPKGDEPDDTLRQALKQFQKDNDLDTTGEADQSTQDKIVELHGS